MIRIHNCAAFHVHRLGVQVRLLVARTLGVCIAALLMGAMLAAFLWPPVQVYARSPHMEMAQDVPVTDEASQSSTVSIEPNLAPVQIDLSAIISGNLVVYTLYATNVTEQSVWDLNIRIPLPAGTMLLSAQSSSPFVTDYRDAVVSFYVAARRPNTGSGPQRVVAVVLEEGEFLVSTHAEASWEYLDSIMRQSSMFQMEAQTSAISMYPGRIQQVVADMVDETPLAHVDLAGITIQQEGSIFRVDFQVAGPLGAAGEPAEYIMYIDADCDVTTGRSRDGLGAEYRVRYRHERGQADLSAWTQAAGASGQWLLTGSIAVNSPIGGHAVTLWIPSVLLDNSSQFCWMAESQQRAAAGAPKLPKDRLPNGLVDPTFTQFGGWDELQSAQSNLWILSAAAAGDDAGGTGQAVQSSPSAQSPSISQPSGKLAIPLSNAQGAYDVHIFSVPDGQLLQQIPDASQPAFGADGAHLLITREADNGAGVYQYELGDEAGVQSGVMPASSYPSYNLQGTRMVYEESSGLPLSERSTYSVTLMQCELSAIPQASGGNCQASSMLIARTSVDGSGEVHGTNPVWTANDQVIYRGCHFWNGVERCGIYATQSATDGLGEPSFPTLLTHDVSAFPNDSKGNFVTLAAQQAGDWEIYALSLDGTWLVNVSRDRLAQDGLSAISPDGNWVAFVSNRDGVWAIWVSSLAGGIAEKLFDLPSGGVWAQNEQEWGRQRLSWGR